MKISLIVVIFSFVLSCGSTQKKSDAQSETTERSTSIDPADNQVKEPSKIKLLNDSVNVYAESILQEDLKEVLYTLASDAYEGRFTGEPGQKKAAQFITDYYKTLGISAANSDGNYLQEIPQAYFKGNAKFSSENVVAYIKGTEKPDEYVVISAHYDHVGVKGGKVYNGADDDASGTTAVLEIAKAFQKAGTLIMEYLLCMLKQAP